jgi:hypothetical protein
LDLLPSPVLKSSFKHPSVLPAMRRTIGSFLLGTLLTLISTAIFAQDNPFQGVYVGTKTVNMANHAFRTEHFPSRMTVLPDGHSILITTQLPGVVMTVAIIGTFQDNIFEGSSRGRMNGATYIWATNFKIRFVRNEAIIESAGMATSRCPSNRKRITRSMRDDLLRA